MCLPPLVLCRESRPRAMDTTASGEVPDATFHVLMESNFQTEGPRSS